MPSKTVECKTASCKLTAMRQQQSSSNFCQTQSSNCAWTKIELSCDWHFAALISAFHVQSTKMGEIIYHWMHSGEKNVVTLGDCCSDNLFEDLDCQFDSEVSDGIVNVDDRVLKSLGEIEAWAENFSRSAGRDNQRATNQGQKESNTKKWFPSASTSALPSASTSTSASPPPPCQPLPQSRRRQLGLLRFNFRIDHHNSLWSLSGWWWWSWGWYWSWWWAGWWRSCWRRCVLTARLFLNVPPSSQPIPTEWAWSRRLGYGNCDYWTHGNENADDDFIGWYQISLNLETRLSESWKHYWMLINRGRL